MKRRSDAIGRAWKSTPCPHRPFAILRRYCKVTRRKPRNICGARLKINPKYADARSKLGLSLAFAGRVREAKAAFQKALKVDPRHAEALLGLGQLARTEGRFEEAESFIKRALKVNRRLPGAWAAMNSIRRMTTC